MRTRFLPVVTLLAMGCGETSSQHDHMTHDTAAGTTTGTGTTTGSTATGLAIAGSWTDNWGMSHDISETRWTQIYGASAPSVFHISWYDNDQQAVVAQNDEYNAWSGGLWSRFDWKWGDDDTLWFCQATYSASTEQEALDLPRADDSDPEGGGCGAFAWTPLLP